MKSMKQDIIDNLKEIEELIPDFITLTEMADENKNVDFFIIFSCDLRKVLSNIKYQVESHKTKINHA